MPTFLTSIPAALVALRICLSPYLLWDAWDGQTGVGFLVAFIVAVFSDIFDGIIARRLGVSTAGLRQADSWAGHWPDPHLGRNHHDVDFAHLASRCAEYSSCLAAATGGFVLSLCYVLHCD